MAEERYRVSRDISRIGSPERLPTLERAPLWFFDWMLARVLAGEPVDIGEQQLRTFQEGFVPAEFDFSNLRRHVCVAAIALLAGLPMGASPAAGLEFAHRTWNGGRQDLETAIEGCGAAAAACDGRELASWWERAQRQPSLDWVESFEETLFLLDPSRVELAPQALAAGVARVASGPLAYASSISTAPLVCALWHCTKARDPVRELLSGRVQELDEVVFGSEGEAPLLKIGKLVRSGHGVLLRVRLGRGVELSLADEQGFRARIVHSWAHIRRSFREVTTGALVEFIR
ncbi:hypothetical protein OV090_26910 [Nannocystis sp. RBIL2]|uniref:hypothetical protein n=1 Tax=Nannocystis sp. RBIL2 TaxID=2996788 RepID=UPI0022708EC7|nr:hypothetical protein [Nannocystis sp. RBIL2]MCY1068402.1 hypothetical protein [Nannocystis sp. RBIL2]